MLLWVDLTTSTPSSLVCRSLCLLWQLSSRGRCCGDRGLLRVQGCHIVPEASTLCPQFHCCGSNNSLDWTDSKWVKSSMSGGRVVPDSCCKTKVTGCGKRDHPSNIYKVEVSVRGLLVCCSGTVWDSLPHTCNPRSLCCCAMISAQLLNDWHQLWPGVSGCGLVSNLTEQLSCLVSTLSCPLLSHSNGGVACCLFKLCVSSHPRAPASSPTRIIYHCLAEVLRSSPPPFQAMCQGSQPAVCHKCASFGFFTSL